MGQVIEEGRNAVRGLRSSRTASLDLEQSFALVPQEIANTGGAGPAPEYRVVVIGEKRPLRPLMRDEVYRIGREALTNAFRHSRARKIEIELKYLAFHLRVLVRDDGRGMDAEIVQSGREGHWGLPGMRERAERIGAQLHVRSRVDAGTEVELTVPGYIAFEDSRRFWTLWLGGSFRRKGKTSK
jgi:signal transduction histidine kinase